MREQTGPWLQRSWARQSLAAWDSDNQPARPAATRPRRTRQRGLAGPLLELFLSISGSRGPNPGPALPRPVQAAGPLELAGGSGLLSWSRARAHVMPHSSDAQRQCWACELQTPLQSSFWGVVLGSTAPHWPMAHADGSLGEARNFPSLLPPAAGPLALGASSTAPGPEAAAEALLAPVAATVQNRLVVSFCWRAPSGQVRHAGWLKSPAAPDRNWWQLEGKWPRFSLSGGETLRMSILGP